MPSTGSGSLVFRIDPLAPAAATLREHDVVMEIEGVPIADDGTVEFRNEERVEFSHIVRSKHIGVRGALAQWAPPTPCVMADSRSGKKAAVLFGHSAARAERDKYSGFDKHVAAHACALVV